MVKKEFPHNIDELMTPVVLAHLIMGDGNLKRPDKIIRIYTNSFIKKDVELLASAITNKLEINTKVVHNRNNQFIISISKSELQKVIDHIKDHMHPSMFYKIDLEKSTYHEFNDNNIYLLKKSAVYYGDLLDQYT
jgi:hypothetical protein